VKLRHIAACPLGCHADGRAAIAFAAADASLRRERTASSAGMRSASSTYLTTLAMAAP
jgi:hypothetical protein